MGDVEKSFDFNTASDYIYDPFEVEVNNGIRLVLKNNSGLEFIQAFDDDSGFVYDDARAEFASGKVQQKDTRPAGATFAATYFQSLDISWADDLTKLAATIVGESPIFVGNRMISENNDIRAVKYPIDNFKSTNQGAIRLKYQPNYLGSPGSNEMLLDVGSNLNLRNRVRIYHSDTGNLVASVYDSDGNIIADIQEAWSPLSGVEYDIELNWDVEIGETRLFIDGAQVGATQPGTGNRTLNDLQNIWISINRQETLTANHRIGNIVFFNVVQHVSNFIPEPEVENFIYLENKIQLPQFPYIAPGSIQTYDLLTTVENRSPKYIINGQYWDGANWLTSDGSYTQANNVISINLNLGLLTIDDSVFIDIVFPDDNLQNDVDNLICEYTAQEYLTGNPAIEIDEEFNIEKLLSFIETSNISGSDNIKYILYINNIAYYFNSAWVESDGSYQQSNTADEININLNTFANDRIVFKIKLFLHSADGTTTPEVKELRIVYDFAGQQLDMLTTITVWGFICDADTLPDISKITAKLNKEIVLYKNNTQIVGDTIETDVRDDGYWELNLVETENMEIGSYYIFIIKGKEYNKILQASPPAGDNISFNLLADA